MCYGTWSALLRLPASRARLGRPCPSAWWAWSAQLLRAPAGPRQAGSPLDLCLSHSSPRAPLAPALRPWPRDPVHCPRARARRRARVGALCPTRTTCARQFRVIGADQRRIRPNRVWRRAVAPLSGVCRRHVWVSCFLVILYDSIPVGVGTSWPSSSFVQRRTEQTPRKQSQHARGVRTRVREVAHPRARSRRAWPVFCVAPAP